MPDSGQDVRQGRLGPYDLTGRVAVVTGASGGIGAAAAAGLAELGARVVVGYHRSEQRAAQVRDALPGDGHLTLPIALGETASVRAAAASVGDAFGRCDVLVNSAGTTAAVPAADLEALDDATFDRILSVNVRGTFAVIRAFAPLLRASGDAAVVNVSSISAFTGKGSSIAYCASKAAVDCMTRSLARVLAPEVRVVSVSPAAVATDFVPGRDLAAVTAQAASTPLRTVAYPEDVAQAILAAVCQLRLSTGTVLVVDGGRHL
jgi:3-oxoacyl-[acyl-carrier protein] reductase